MTVTKKSKQNSRSLNSDIPWNLDRIDQRSDVLDGKYSFNSTGKNVNVYVIDTGILVSHGMLASALYTWIIFL